MTEATTTPEFQMPETVRALRHYIDRQAHKICPMLVGQPGLTKDEQIERVTGAIRYAERVQEGLAALLELVTTRDFEARQAEKAAEKAQIDADFKAIVLDEDDEDEDD